MTEDNNTKLQDTARSIIDALSDYLDELANAECPRKLRRRLMDLEQAGIFLDRQLCLITKDERPLCGDGDEQLAA